MLPKNILVIEDELMAQLLLKDIFSDLCIYCSDFIDTSEKTLDILKNNAYDMIIMDINIKGGLDGIRLSKRIVKQYDIPIVFLTSYYDQETIDEAIEISPYGYIKKPFTPIDIKLALTVAYSLFKKEKLSINKKSIDNDMIFINYDYTYSKQRELLLFQNKPIKLSKQQTILLKTLIRNINQTVSEDTLIYEIWGNNYISESSLRTLLYFFRKKCPNIPIQNNSYKGYYLKTI